MEDLDKFLMDDNEEEEGNLDLCVDKLGVDDATLQKYLELESRRSKFSKRSKSGKVKDNDSSGDRSSKRDKRLKAIEDHLSSSKRKPDLQNSLSSHDFSDYRVNN